ncbi:hypothetical protein [Sphingobium lignivorans]|uniref:Uncharacterized protein n=1 Tax=Sphingobium lignivorans TaxID=2735886 RepID=A0ABR6NJY6_9SPHN|nr:hypothetical protein [Sphingobium lignivorans]MBB5987426.1 hypothetical protein [Sphingobium lignivorans]
MIFAKQRLFLTADGAALVAEGDPAGATLYAAPGDEIPASAAEKFGLVDGDLPDPAIATMIADDGAAALEAQRKAEEEFLSAQRVADEEAGEKEQAPAETKEGKAGEDKEAKAPATKGARSRAKAA